MRTLAEAVDDLAGWHQTGITFCRSARESGFLSYAAIHAAAQRRARRYRADGLRRGERVALVLFEESEIVLGFLGAVLVGAVPVIVNPRHAIEAERGNPEALAAILADCRPRLGIVSASLRAAVEGVRATPAPPLACAWREPVTDADGDNGRRGVDQPDSAISPDDLCFLQYTSGSTGAPRGVMVTHRNLMTNALACARMGEAGDPGRAHCLVSWLPLYHDMGLVGFLVAPMLRRASITLFSPTLFARRPSVWLDLLSDTGADVTGAPNFAFSFLLRRLKGIDPRRYDLSRLRVLFCGGEPIQADALDAFAEWLAPAGLDRRCFLPCYGLAETTLAASLPRPMTPLKTDVVSRARLRHGAAAPAAPGEAAVTLVSCGLPLPGHSIEIVGAGGVAAAERQVGEVRVRGPSVTPGYFDEHGASPTAPPPRWLDTGDLGYLAAGELYICGRAKDLIIIRGVNHYPQDLEWTVERIRGLRGRTVAAIATTRDGEEGVTIIVECPLGAADEEGGIETVIAEAIRRGHGVVPHAVRLVPLGALPLTSSGKIRRRETKAMYEAGLFEPVAQVSEMARG
jgi:acyl-CoA synthetase (AMP-forming)/AMP-acid ligase II